MGASPSTGSALTTVEDHFGGRPLPRDFSRLVPASWLHEHCFRLLRYVEGQSSLDNEKQRRTLILRSRRAIESLGNQKSRPSFTAPTPVPMSSGKLPRKRQKSGKHSSSKSKKRLVALDDEGGFEPLGSSKHVWEDEDKDDEERRLESVLFGKPYVPSSKGRTGDESDEEDEDMLEADVDLAGNEFANLMDSEVRCAHAHIGEMGSEFDSGSSYSWWMMTKPIPLPLFCPQVRRTKMKVHNQTTTQNPLPGALDLTLRMI